MPISAGGRVVMTGSPRFEGLPEARPGDAKMQQTAARFGARQIPLFFALQRNFFRCNDRFIPLFGLVAEFPHFLAEFLEFSVSNPAQKQPIPFIFRWNSGIPLIKPRAWPATTARRPAP
jgi:hypothetical protein